MTKITLGIAVAAIMLTLGIGAQIPAFAESDPLADVVKKTGTETFGSTDTMMLVAISPTHKGGVPTFMLVPRPVENIDGIPTPTPAGPEMILVAHTSSDGKSVLTWVPKPAPSLVDYSS